MTTDTYSERALGWLKQPVDERDYQLLRVHPEIAAMKLSGLIDLEGSPNMPPVGNQLSIGSCVAWGCIANWRFSLRRGGLVDFDGSELFEYANARILGGFPLSDDSGAYIRDGIKALVQNGNAPESDWPYDVSKYTIMPPQQAYQNAQGHQALRYISIPNNDDAIDGVLEMGFPVVFGIPLYQNWPMGNGIFTIPEPQGQIIGGHCMNYVGYDRARRKRKIRNQWGSAWGRGGYAEISYDYSRQAQDCWYIETVEGDPNVPPPPPPPPPVKTVDGIGIWTYNTRTGIITPNVQLWAPSNDEQVGGIGVHFLDGSAEERWPKP